MRYRIIVEFESTATREEVFNVMCDVSDYIGESIETADKEGWYELP